MSAPPPAAVALVWSGDESTDESYGPQLADLLERGWDAHLLCERDDPTLVGGSADLSDGVLRARVHPPPRRLRSAVPRPHVLTGAVQAVVRQPDTALRQLGGAPDPLVRYLRAALLGTRPKVVHLSSPWALDRYAGVVSALGAGALVSVTGDGAWPLALGDPSRLVACLAGADAVHTESEALAAELRREGLDREVVVIPPAHDAGLQTLTREVHEDRAVRILSVGPLTWAQGYEHALQGVALLAARGVACKYRIVGRGDFADAVDFARHQLGLERLVEIVEPGDRAALREQLEWADVLVSSAVVPRSSKALLDARAAGLPVVTTEAPADGVDTAIVVPRRDPEALCEQLARLARDDGLRRRLGDAGRLAAATTMTAEERLSRFRDLYGRLLGRGPTAARESTI